jgi:hypothetical protein
MAQLGQPQPGRVGQFEHRRVAKIGGRVPTGV